MKLRRYWKWLISPLRRFDAISIEKRVIRQVIHSLRERQIQLAFSGDRTMAAYYNKHIEFYERKSRRLRKVLKLHA